MTKKETKQMEAWGSDFGRDYTDRNPQSFDALDKLYQSNFGVTRTELNEEFLGSMDRSIRILEVGANVGVQLQGLQKMGFHYLYGIELQSYAVEIAKARTQGVNLIQGSAFDIPFKDGFFDLVYTSGVLIHLSPDEILSAFSEIYRCSRSWIWGFEYFAEDYTSINYRGRNDLLWKADFCRLYQKAFPDLRLVKSKQIPYIASDNVDSMFLLKK